MQLHGIITGDIVLSGKIAPAVREKLFSDIDGFLKQLKKSWISSYETYRGDSLQCASRMPQQSLRLALIIRSFFRAYVPEKIKLKESALTNKKPTRGYFAAGFDIRLSIGIGKADFINKNKITASDGEAFRLSGEGLDALLESSQRLAVNTLKADFNEQIEPAILFLDALMQKWTRNQAELVLYKLQNKKEEEIASLLNISQPAVNQRTRTAQWYAINKLVQHFEKTVQTWL